MDVQASAPGTGTLRRSITLGQLVFFGLVFIGPAAAVGIFGTLDAKSSGAVATVYVIATLVMAFTARSYMRMSREVPRAGSVFAYAGTGIGPRAGYVSGWTTCSFPPSPTCSRGSPSTLCSRPSPSGRSWRPRSWPRPPSTSRALQLASKVITGVVLLEVLVLMVVLVCGAWVLATRGATRPWLSPFTGVGGFSTTAVLAAVSVAVLSFLGFDALATFAEEAKGSVRMVGRATILCLVIAGVLFVAQSYVGALLSPTTPAELAANPGLEGAAYYNAVGTSIGPWLHWLVALSKAAGAAFAAMVGQGAGSRIIMDTARERRLPGGLAKVSVRTGGLVPDRQGTLLTHHQKPP
jgi:amino acid transporter